MRGEGAGRPTRAEGLSMAKGSRTAQDGGGGRRKKETG